MHLFIDPPEPEQRSSDGSRRSSGSRPNRPSSTGVIPVADAPHQPSAHTIEPQQLNNRALRFQNSWYVEYPWVHIHDHKSFCFPCLKALNSNVIATKADPAFTSKGFKNWKKAKDKMAAHAASHAHKLAATVISAQAKPVDRVLSVMTGKAQTSARENLHVLFTSVTMLAKQGLPLLGHGKDEGNYRALLELRCEDRPELGKWLSRRQNFTHPDVQNEMLSLLSRSVLRKIVQDVNCSGTYSVMVDGTQDVSKKEQESICVRYADDDLNLYEEFMGFYEVDNTSGRAMAETIKDALLRYGIPIGNMRGMSFDGAANMSGCYKGAQALLKQEQPQAVFVHCAAHSVNLAGKDAFGTSLMFTHAMQTVNEIGTLFSDSMTMRNKFHKVCSEQDMPSRLSMLRPLCPTRWSVRLSAVEALLSQYAQALDALEQLAESSSHVSVRAAGLHAQMGKTETFVALSLARQCLQPLDRLCLLAQRKETTISEICRGVEAATEYLQALRTSADDAISAALAEADKLELAPMELPRKKKVPRRYDDGAAGHHPATASEHVRTELLAVLDTIRAQLRERFEQEGIREVRLLEKLLLEEVSAAEVVRTAEQIKSWPPELVPQDLGAQLHVFRSAAKFISITEAVSAFRELGTGNFLLPQVKALLRALLVIPASTATPERSFSALRRLKSWLRATMGQERLNALAIAHVHGDRVKNVSIDSLITEFVSKSDSRKLTFGP